MESIVHAGEKAGCGEVAAIDTEIRSIIPLEDARDSLRAVSGRGTSLEAPVRELLDSYGKVLVVTDAEGAGCLAAFRLKKLGELAAGLLLIEVAK